MRLLEGEIPPLQNEDWFLSSNYLKGTPHHYKMTIGFYMFLSSGYLKVTLQYYKMKICFYHEVKFHHYKMKIGFYVFLSSGYLKGTLPKGNFPCYKMRLGFHMLSSDGQILLLQNDFRFKGCSTTETLKT